MPGSMDGICVATHARQRHPRIPVIMLRNGTCYEDLGADHFRRASPEAQASRLARQITRLGFTCIIQPVQDQPPVSV